MVPATRVPIARAVPTQSSPLSPDLRSRRRAVRSRCAPRKGRHRRQHAAALGHDAPGARQREEADGGHQAHLKIFGHAISAMNKITFYFILVILILVDVVQTAYQKNILKGKS